jgi:lysophospholipase L1-like esterase
MPPEDQNPKTKSRRSPLRRVRFAVLYSLYVAGVLFLGLKLYGWFVFDVPLTRTSNADDVWRLYYPELWQTGAVDSDAKPGDGRLDVLLLGASVLEQMTEPLERELKQRYGDNVRLYNLSKSAHTTRDSRQKFSRLKDKQFDLIVVYHGINDVRMNCVPRAEYRDDYSHCAWYASFAQKLKYGAISVRGVAADLKTSIGLGPPDVENRKYGGDVKTAAAFRANLEAIVSSARERKIPVVLMTFATYLPPDYTKERFQAGKLDYGEGRFKLPTEVWGNPRDVLAAVKVHNAVIRDVAAKYDNVRFVDQEKLLPRNGKVFADVCHLTPHGCELFAKNLAAAVNLTVDGHRQ